MSMLSEEELAEAVEVVCMTVFDMPVTTSLHTDLRVDECLEASIDISGAWEGRVQVRASQRFLRLAASRIFLKTVDEVDHQDCVDTIAELTNMLGGTVKCMLPESCSLGLPMMVLRDQFANADDEWHCFDYDQLPLAVAVMGTSTGERHAA